MFFFSPLTWCEMTLVLIKKASLSLSCCVCRWRMAIERGPLVGGRGSCKGSSQPALINTLHPSSWPPPALVLIIGLVRRRICGGHPAVPFSKYVGSAARHLARASAPAAPRDMHANWRRRLCMCTPSRLRPPTANYTLTQTERYNLNDI